MSTDLSKVTGISDSRGNIVEIKDSAGRVIWSGMDALVDGDVAILQVQKHIVDVYKDAESFYEDEKFVAVGVTPISGGTVTVTYGALTKTVTDDGTSESPNAQQVYFGTYKGVSDSTVTPDSGILTISGSYSSFRNGSYQSAKLGSSSGDFITQVLCFGKLTHFSLSMFSVGPFGSGGTSSLEKVSMSSRITSMGSNLTGSPTCLKRITIPASLTSITDDAFLQCQNLTNIFVQGSNPNYSASAGKLYNKQRTILHAFPSAKGVCIIPDSITEITPFAFHGTSVTSVICGNQVASIGSYAFMRCNSLTDIQSLLNNVVSIGMSAFLMRSADPVALQGSSITLPSTLRHLGSRAFDWDKDADTPSWGYLDTITVLATTPPDSGLDEEDSDDLSTINFFGDPAKRDITVIVPKGCASAYKSAKVWRKYNIVEAS